MKNDQLSQIWKSQSNDLSLNTSQNIIKKAKKQRSGQFITITVLSITLIILIIYAIKFAMGNWNNFALGLMLMISSLAFRLLLEFITIYRKESQLIVLDNQSFQKYLKKYYKIRLKVNQDSSEKDTNSVLEHTPLPSSATIFTTPHTLISSN